MKYLIFLFPLIAWADNSHHVKYINTPTSGTALGIANAQLNFDKGTYGWQWSAGAGFYDDSEAVSFGMGKRYGNTLINGTIGSEDGKTGFGVGISGKF